MKYDQELWKLNHPAGTDADLLLHMKEIYKEFII